MALKYGLDLFRKKNVGQPDHHENHHNREPNKVDDLGYAVIISIDYFHNAEHDAKNFFVTLKNLLVSTGFSIDGRVFYRVGSKDTVESLLKAAINHTKSTLNLSPHDFLRSIHLVPLTQFYDVTHTLTAV